MIFLHRLDKEWYKDDTPQLWEGVVDNPGELASWDDLEYCMNNPQSYQIIFLEKDSGEPFTLNEYPRSWSHDAADVSEVFKAFKEGHNIIINNFDSGFRTKQQQLGEVEKIFNGQCAMHLYAGIGECSSFRVHEDMPSNFIIQVEGETQWTVYKNRCAEIVKDFTINDKPDIIDTLEVAIDTILKPGDVIYIPPRTYHRASPSGKRLSVSIPIQHGIEHMKPKDRNWYKL
tara:strand:+ start:10010 stop:10699 length:690 start_codon:yes stop_codon:yes gene_type:complete